MITKEVIGNELYVWIWERGIKSLLYKRWINKDYGVVMDRQPFTAKDVEQFKLNIHDSKVYTSHGSDSSSFRRIEL